MSSDEPLSLFSSKRQIRVLMVDDDEADHALAKTSIARSHDGGYSVFKIEMDFVTNAELAARLIKSESHDVYVVDWKLRWDGEGLDLIRECVKAGMKGPFVMISGMPEAFARRAQAEMAGLHISDFLDKARLLEPDFARAITFAFVNFSKKRRGWRTSAFGFVGAIGTIILGLGHIPADSNRWLLGIGLGLVGIGILGGSFFAADSRDVKDITGLANDLRKIVEKK